MTGRDSGLTPADAEGPLAGIEVLDVSRILSGPFCTMLLRDLGAEVIKIEHPARGDAARKLGPLVAEDSSYFMSVNRGKKSVALDIFQDEGQELFRRLASTVDVVVENYVPGTMERLGMDYRRLKESNPGLVYASISGFGQTGPYSQRPALDIVIQAMGGLMSVTGQPDGPPLRPGASLGDSIAGLFTTLAIVSALHSRHSSGVGQYIDMSMLDCQVTMMENALARYFATGQIPKAIGSRHPAATPFQTFATADGHIVVALLTNDPGTWRNLCQALGLPDLADDPRFRDNQTRTEHHPQLEPLLQQAFGTKPSQTWIQELSDLRIPCGPINDIEEVAHDPQIAQREMVVPIPHRDLGSWKVANTPFKFSRTASGPRGPSPGLGEHTDEILARNLGLPEEEILRLRTAGLI